MASNSVRRPNYPSLYDNPTHSTTIMSLLGMEFIANYIKSVCGN